jgi:hypothetical protein
LTSPTVKRNTHSQISLAIHTSQSLRRRPLPARIRRIRFPHRPAALASRQSPSFITCQSASPRRPGRRGESCILFSEPVAVKWCSALDLPSGASGVPGRGGRDIVLPLRRVVNPPTTARSEAPPRARGAAPECRVACGP